MTQQTQGQGLSLANQVGKYRINAVSEQTGVAPATLRAWERRYGLPDPGRTNSSYRLYSDHDVAMIRRVRELCDSGMSASEAAKKVREEASRWEEAPANTSDAFDAAREGLVQAVYAFEPERVDGAIRHAIALGSATSIADRVFVPAMRELGVAWHEGRISIAQEHMASQKLTEAVSSLLRLVEPPVAERTVLLACYADDEHTFVSTSLALHLASWGHRVVRLGARTPPSAIADAVKKIQPQLVCLSATLQPPPHRARELADGYGDACTGVPWVVGGAAAATMAEHVERNGGQVVPSGQASNVRGTLEALMVPKKPKRPRSKRS